MPATGTATAPAPTPSGPVNPALVEQKTKLQARMRSGAGWFMAVALFSVVNSALVFFQAEMHFIVGLGVHRRDGPYALDGLIFLGFGLWLDLAFHAFAIFNIYKGLSALNPLNQLNRQPAAVGTQPIIRLRQ